MAITYEGAGAQAVSTTSGGTVTAAWPAGYTAVADDVAVVIGVGQHNVGSSSAPSAPSGYTQATTSFREVGTYDLQLTVWYKVLTTSESAPATTVPAAYSGTSGGLSMQVLVFRGVDTSTPMDASAVASNAAAAATNTPTGITTVTDLALVVSVASSADDNALSMTSEGSGFREYIYGASYDTASGGDHAVAAAGLVIPDGGGSFTMPTWTETAVGNDAWSAITLALRPATTASVPVRIESIFDDTVTSDTVTVTYSGNETTGDIAVLVGYAQSYTTGSSPSLSTPTGYTLVHNAVSSDGATNAFGQPVWYRILDGSEGSGVASTRSDTDKANYWGLELHIIRGASGIDDSSHWESNAWDANRRIPGYTTTVDDCLVLGLAYSFAADAGPIHPIGWSNAKTPDGYVWTRAQLAAGTFADTDYDALSGNILRVTSALAFAPPGGTDHPLSIAGSATATGAARESIGKLVAGSATTSGVIAMGAAKSTVGSLILAGAAAKNVGKRVTGTIAAVAGLARSSAKRAASTITAAGATTVVWTVLATIAGTITATSVIARSSAKRAASTTTATGVAARSTSKATAGSATPTAVLAALRTVLTTITGTITTTSTIARAASKRTAGSLNAAAVTARAAAKRPIGSITAAAVVVRTAAKRATGATTAAGAAARSAAKRATGSIALAAVLARTSARLLAGTSTPAGNARRAVVIFRHGSISATAVARRSVTKIFLAALAATGSLATAIAAGSDRHGRATSTLFAAGATGEAIAASATATLVAAGATSTYLVED